MTVRARKEFSRSTMSDNVWHRRVSSRMPIRRREPIEYLAERKTRSAVGHPMEVRAIRRRRAGLSTGISPERYLKRILRESDNDDRNRERRQRCEPAKRRGASHEGARRSPSLLSGERAAAHSIQSQHLRQDAAGRAERRSSTSRSWPARRGARAARSRGRCSSPRGGHVPRAVCDSSFRRGETSAAATDVVADCVSGGSTGRRLRDPISQRWPIAVVEPLYLWCEGLLGAEEIHTGAAQLQERHHDCRIEGAATFVADEGERFLH